MALQKTLCGKSVTDVLMRAMEHADSMKHVAVVYTTNDDDDATGGFFAQDDIRMDELNWMLDLVKSWIFD